MAEYIVKPDYTMLSKNSHGNIYKWNFGTDTEPEHIVRCDDCKHSYYNGTACNHPMLSGGFNGNSYLEIDPDGFCAWGEER